MVKGGFGEGVIINAIQASDTQFDVSLDALFRLKEAGVSQRIIEAMQSAAARQQAAPTGTRQAVPGLAPSALPPQGQLSQPYVLYGEKSKVGIPASSPTIIQTKAKGDSVPALLADSAVKDIAGDAIISVAARSVLAAPGVAGLPIIGLAGAALLSLPKMFGGEPTYTFVYALSGRRSASIVSTVSPRFEVVFSDVVGANPDEFEPVLVKISPTDNNWRLVGAQKAKAKQFQSNDLSELNFIEERIATSVTRLERGRIVVTPQQPLLAGEYGLVLRPVSKTKKASLRAVAARQGDGLLLGPVWDFSVTPAPQVSEPSVQPSPAQASLQAHEAPVRVGQSKAADPSGSVTIRTSRPYDKAYDAVLDFLKGQGKTIESSSKETGQIITGLTVAGGYRQTGTKIQVTFFKDGENVVSIKVIVTEQKRYKALKTEPWGDAKIHAERSDKLAAELMTMIAAL